MEVWEWEWEWLGVWECAARPCHNKGFARRPQEFLAWEEFLGLGAGRRKVGMEEGRYGGRYEVCRLEWERYGGMWYVGMEV